MRTWSRDARQAAWLSLGIWTLSCGLFVLPVYLDRGGIPAPLLTHVLALYIAGMALTTVVHAAAVLVRRRFVVLKLVVMAAAVVLAAMLLGVVDMLASWIIQTPPPGDPFDPVAEAAKNLVAFVWLYGLIAAILVLVQANRTLREHEKELADARAAEVEARTAAARAEAAATAARLSALRYQLNPHLLFNALNAASSLVVTRRNDEAEAMIAKLTDFLRSTLAADPQAAVTVGDELATIETYLDIEAVRFGDRLRVTVDCPPELEDVLMPGFLLQPLVENAIKYAVGPTREAVAIRVHVARDDDELAISVEDDGDPDKAATIAKGTGVGLANVRQRLETLYGARGRLSAGPTTRGFRATAYLPIEYVHAAMRGIA